MRIGLKTILCGGILFLSACCTIHTWHQAPTVLRLIGDSTMADKPVAETPERGWGQLFPQFYRADIQVVNYARNGRSTKSFIAEGLWAKVLADLRRGDYLFIQFGHNDAKSSDTSRYAAPHTTYRANLIRFVEEARACGAQPILITPVARRYFSPEGILQDAHGEYPGVVKEVAALYKVPLIDLHARSMQRLAELGPERSERLFMRVPPGLFKALPDGKSDNTHFMEEGAVEMAKLVIAGLREMNHPLIRYFKPEAGWPQPQPPSWPIPLATTPKP
ncbi:MAG TPA: rhamnogalacturonan acetylesterase [bacterium]|nr:rhamnogalacturonan acetylesterase [bacterium]HQG46733.1 rhamnogalacturonan acetylesterase [bacterium]HQI49028.1 rhamnogalacturonan acetylesterase [bacterium]HQJ65955.1 rhamnogalacturonan acetylesterase [bacterium]